MLLALVGPTASGKTEAGIAVAERLGAEIVSVDSMLVYRGMDIGTAKPTAAQRERVRHHLLDVAEPSERFTVARYQELARGLLPLVDRPLLVGGSGLYFRAIVDGLAFPPEDAEVRRSLETELGVLGPARLHERLRWTDPAAAGKIDAPNARRTVRALEVAALTGEPFSSFAEPWTRYDPASVRAVGIRIDRAALAARSEARVHAMLDAGWLEEVAGLVARGFGGWLTASQAIGYAEFARHLDGRLSFDEAVDRTVRRTRELGRRQMTWFARDPRIRWIDAGAGGAMDVVDELGAALEGA